ncbi:hypothetical protein L249_4259 [Ophiocordyceps polyrhachis-furcata BCC 54312]|uniref:Uncharacterized protein n=1 Tax=Ophiocordyceps polyrhachis-furcata BCC 54312 TaxID=1330021 RepID=A0A367L7H1_9HYPO|nr:hypothetical protein L249_4259 [Ophiocordyceps polyrhachis-furcata BCC 54312]
MLRRGNARPSYILCIDSAFIFIGPPLQPRRTRPPFPPLSPVQSRNPLNRPYRRFCNPMRPGRNRPRPPCSLPPLPRRPRDHLSSD